MPNNQGQYSMDDIAPLVAEQSQATAPTTGQYKLDDIQTPSFIDTDVYPALKGSAKGIATGLGIPQTDHPLMDMAKALNEQVNRIATTPWATGGPIWGVLSTAGHGLIGSGKSAIETLPKMLEAAKNNDVEGFYKAAGTGITSLLMLKSLLSTNTEPMTLGMEKGGLTGQIERIANRIPVSSRPLQSVYQKVADNFQSTVADNVGKLSGIKGDPSDLVGTLNKGADSVKALSQQAYAPVDTYMLGNTQFYQNALRQVSTLDPDIIKQIPPSLANNPINALKQVGDALYKKGTALLNGGQGIAAKNYFDLNDELKVGLDNIVQSLPPNIKASYDIGQKLYNRQAAMSDIAETFDKNISGLPPSRQPSGVAKVPQQINGISLIDALRDEPRLKQAFGPDVAEAITQHAHRVALSQALKGGSSNAANIVGMMYGTSILARIWTLSGLSTIPIELAGVYALSKVLSNPASLPAYANMLRATSQTGQDYWGKRAIDSATTDHSASQLSLPDVIDMGHHFMGRLSNEDLRADIGAAIHEHGR